MRSYSAFVDAARRPRQYERRRRTRYGRHPSLPASRRPSVDMCYPGVRRYIDDPTTVIDDDDDDDVLAGFEDDLITPSPLAVSFDFGGGAMSPAKPGVRSPVRTTSPILDKAPLRGSVLPRPIGRPRATVDEALTAGGSSGGAGGSVTDVETGSSAAGYLRDQISSLFQVSDNKLALKLFGSRNALQKEKQRQKESGDFVIHPCSSFRFVFLSFFLL